MITPCNINGVWRNSQFPKVNVGGVWRKGEYTDPGYEHSVNSPLYIYQSGWRNVVPFRLSQTSSLGAKCKIELNGASILKITTTRTGSSSPDYFHINIPCIKNSLSSIRLYNQSNGGSGSTTLSYTGAGGHYIQMGTTTYSFTPTVDNVSLNWTSYNDNNPVHIIEIYEILSGGVQIFPA